MSRKKKNPIHLTTFIYSKLKITKMIVMVETSAKENLQLAWSWIRELAKEANQLSMTTTKSKWLPISKLYII